jgi:hypothetical protein
VCVCTYEKAQTRERTLNHAKTEEKLVPVHGTRAGQKAKVEQSENDDGAKTRLAFRDVPPSQVRPVLIN